MCTASGTCAQLVVHAYMYTPNGTCAYMCVDTLIIRYTHALMTVAYIDHTIVCKIIGDLFS